MAQIMDQKCSCFFWSHCQCSCCFVQGTWIFSILSRVRRHHSDLFENNLNLQNLTCYVIWSLYILFQLINGIKIRHHIRKNPMVKYILNSSYYLFLFIFNIEHINCKNCIIYQLILDINTRTENFWRHILISLIWAFQRCVMFKEFVTRDQLRLSSYFDTHLMRHTDGHFPHFVNHYFFNIFCSCSLF